MKKQRPWGLNDLAVGRNLVTEVSLEIRVDLLKV